MATYRIWPATNGPATSVTDNQQLTLAMEWHVTSAAWVTHLHFYRGDTSVLGPITGRIWRVETPSTGTIMTADVTFTLAGTGWHTAALATPLALDTTRRYKVAVTFPGRWTLTSAYWTSGPGASGITNGPLSAYSAAAGLNSQGSYTPGVSSTYPATSGVGGNYWVDLTVTDVDPSGSTISPSGVSSTSTVCSPTVTPGVVTISPPGVSCSSAVGSPTVIPGAVTVTPPSVDAVGALGLPTLTAGPVTVSPPGIGSTSTVGAPDVTVGTTFLSPPSLDGVTTVGMPTVVPGSVVVSPLSTGSTSTVGAPTFVVATAPPGLGAAGRLGVFTVVPGAVAVSPPSLGALGALGVPVVATEGARPGALLLTVGQPRVDWVVGSVEAAP